MCNINATSHYKTPHHTMSHTIIVPKLRNKLSIIYIVHSRHNSKYIIIRMDVFCNMLFRCCCSMEYTTRVDETHKMKRYLIHQLGRQRNILSGVIKSVHKISYDEQSKVDEIPKLLMLHSSLMEDYKNNYFVHENLDLFTSDNNNGTQYKYTRKIMPKIVVVGEPKTPNMNT